MVKKRKKDNIVNLNEAYNHVLLWFFSFPDIEMSLNDLSEALCIAKTTASRLVNDLAGEGFLTLKILGKVWRISCNKDHEYNYTKKIAYNLMMIYSSGILKKIHEKIRNPKAIILFGSYRKGDDNEKSDVDIAVEVVGDEGMKIIALEPIPQIWYRKNVPVNLYIFSRNKVDLNLFANIANGIVLEGFLEVKL